MAAFLTGYRETMRDSQLWPADPHATDALINFFLLERVLYDIEDELAHRPEWLRIPLTGLLRILSDPASETV
jgi:maltose alpha-D-glucosyltransferase/alpha-amylase